MYTASLREWFRELSKSKVTKAQNTAAKWNSKGPLSGKHYQSWKWSWNSLKYFFSVFSHKFLILFIFTFEISRHSLKKSEIKGKKKAK